MCSVKTDRLEKSAIPVGKHASRHTVKLWVAEEVRRRAENQIKKPQVPGHKC